MKLKHLEVLRAILLSGAIITSLKVSGDAKVIQNINNFLEQYHINQENINDFFEIGYNLSILTCFNLEQLTREYEVLEASYDYVISNIAELVQYFGIEDNPVKVFALYTYMYRNGYLSNQHEFYYSTDMKDFACLNGVDVIRGTGVCRSISSMFTDICNAVGLTATNVSVKATSKALAKKEKICPSDLKDKDNGKKIARIVGKATSILPLGNHLVTLVDNQDGGLMLDPTNDVYMQLTSGKKFSFANNTSATMSYSFISNIAPRILSQMKTCCSIGKLRRLSKGTTIPYEEYYKTYQETIAMIEANKDVLERFYKLNQSIYANITTLSNKQNGMIKRIIPIIPSRKK